MSARYAFVTLLTSDGYLPGALTVAAALEDVHRAPSVDQSVEYETVCLVTPETVDVSSIRHLRKTFNVVIGVEIIVPPDTGSLTLLGRPDLDTALTKLHVFRLTQYSKVIFLDADVLPLRSLSHLFCLDHDFSAIPDVGWPDIFNSGVMVLSPGEDKFAQLQELLNTKGTWDGADQGLLNEWRGDSWNRLSFTYNTTPTAIYTYAPAYQRFGCQISVIHFIGPHKPWHSIPYRAPGSSTQAMDVIADPGIEHSATHARAYDYESLFDRWYSVYDQHYRTQAVEPVFQPTRYTSTWNKESPRDGIVASGALGLEELRRIALEGMAVSGILVPQAPDEGEYRTMPLEGRFDLIRPRTRAERAQMEAQEDRTGTAESSPMQTQPTTPEPSTPPEQILSLPPSSPVRWTTLPTPGSNEVPPAPHTRLISLPPTPLRHVHALGHKSFRSTREVGSQTALVPLQGQELGSASLFQTSPTSASLVSTPPSLVTSASTDTYFPKIWDIDRNWSSASPPSSETSVTTMEPSPSKLQPTSNALFGSSLVPATPETLRGRHRDFGGKESSSPTPDLTKVKHVFPWEERPRHAPVRVFPDDGSQFSSLRRPPVSATPEKKIAFRSPMPSPLAGFPPSFQSHYPLDGSPIQRHAYKVFGSISSPSPLGLESGLVETDSQDGDVEDEVDSEEETMMRLRSIEKAKRTPKYRSIGVQTDARELREEGVQAARFAEREANQPGHNWSTSAGTTSPAVATTDIPTSFLDHRPSSSRDQATPALNNPSTVSSPAFSSRTGGPAPSHIRKGSRVWNPVRGVDVFKRGSEETLAKFMKIGSQGERA